MTTGEHDGGPAALRSHGPWVDLHAHPGRCFVGPARLPAAAAAARSAGLAATSFSTVGDLAILGFDDAGRIVQAREFESGEAAKDHDRQLAALAVLRRRQDVVVVESAGDIARAHREGRCGAILMAEGADFLGAEAGGLEAAWRAGVRSVTLVHYAQNLSGDVQTSPSRHGGLSAFGVELVREMNRLGIL
ncbi:MAG: membrane dipeptidase, partial [Candidatus Binatia bacterium]